MTRAVASQTESPRAVLVAVVLPDVTDAQASASLDELSRLAKTLGLREVARLTQRRSNANAAAVLGAGKLRELARWTGGSGVVPLGAEKRQKGAQPKSSAAEADVEQAPASDALAIDVDDPSFADPAALEAFVFGDGGDAGDDDDDAAPTDEPAEQASVVIFDHDLSPSQLRNVEGATSAEVLDRSSLILRIFQRHARTREAQLQVEIAQLKYLAPRLRATGNRGDRQRG
ncbi:MAG: GTPase HflX, partial [Myxococcales bacterium]|nr:GTPase HflX [Myxococcales bacterium]